MLDKQREGGYVMITLGIPILRGHSDVTGRHS